MLGSLPASIQVSGGQKNADGSNYTGSFQLAVNSSGITPSTQIANGPNPLFTLLVNQYVSGTLTLTGGSGLAAGTTVSFFSPLTVNPTTLSFTGVPSSQTFTVSQAGPNGSISIGAPACVSNASATVSSNSAPLGSQTTITVTAQAAPNSSPPPTHACTIPVTGAAGQTATVNVDIASSTVIINKGPQPRLPQPAAASGAAPTAGGATVNDRRSGPAPLPTDSDRTGRGGGRGSAPK